jgi:hypothetical protein
VIGGGTHKESSSVNEFESIRGYISYGLLKDDLAIKKEAKKY